LALSRAGSFSNAELWAIKISTSFNFGSDLIKELN